MKKPLVIFFDAGSPNAYPFSVEKYRLSYQLLAETAAKQGIDLRFVLSRSAVCNDPNTLAHYWIWDSDEMKRIDEPFEAGIILNKSRYCFPQSARIVNTSVFEDIARNKLLSNAYFPMVTKPVYPALPSFAPQISEGIQTDLVVVKPILGVSGNGISIISKAQFLDEIESYADRFYLVQEHIDASAGIADLVEGNHDLRIILFEAKPRLAYIRIPAPGKQLANIALGGSLFPVSLADIPQSVQAIVDHCISVLKPLGGSIFTIDCMVENGHPYLLEINDQPGLPSSELGDFTRQFNQYLLDTMIAKRDSSLSDRTPGA